MDYECCVFFDEIVVAVMMILFFVGGSSALNMYQIGFGVFVVGGEVIGKLSSIVCFQSIVFIF